MSFTQTPNLKLYKPTPNADSGQWGYHLNANADALDGIMAASTSLSLSGAVGDGVTNDQPAIQAYLNKLSAAGGGEVLLQPGKWYYITGSPLTIPNNMIVRGAYSAMDNVTAQAGTFFNGGGFLIDPTLRAGIIMGAATALRSCKVYRVGMIANSTNTDAAAAYAMWDAEAFYTKCSAATSNSGSNGIIPLASTAGISVGQQVQGYGLPPNTTVLSITPNTSVTVSNPFNPVVSINNYFRFGSSIGIQLAPGCSGILLDEICIIGFNVGIQGYNVAQYFINRIRGDCSTNIDIFGVFDYSSVRNCEFLPLYGTGFAATHSPDGIFYHDGGGGVHWDNVFMINWHVGWHIANIQGADWVKCSCESPADGVAHINWWIERGNGQVFQACHAQAGGIGWHIQDTNRFELHNCSSASAPTANPGNLTPMAHFLIDATTASTAQMTGVLFGCRIQPGQPTQPARVPILFQGTHIVACVIRDFVCDTVSNASLGSPIIQGGTGRVGPSGAAIMPVSLVQDRLDSLVKIGSVGAGTTITILPYYNGVFIDSGASTLATLTIALPAYPNDGQRVTLVFNVAVTALTFTIAAAASGAPPDTATIGHYNSPVAGTLLICYYSAAQNEWYFGGTHPAALQLATATTVSATPVFNGGVSFGTGIASSPTDLTRHIALYDGSFGLSVTSSQMHLVANSANVLDMLPSYMITNIPLRAGAGMQFGSVLASSETDLSNHIELFGTTYGWSVTTSRLNHVSANAHIFICGTNEVLELQDGVMSFLNATNNIINMSAAGLGPPTFTTRSVGTRLVLYPQITSTTVDVSLGVETSGLWSAVRTTADHFTWYGGTTQAARLTGAGNLTLAGGVGYFGSAAPSAQPTITGACAGNTAIKNLLTQLATQGFLIDGTTA